MADAGRAAVAALVLVSAWVVPQLLPGGATSPAAPPGSGRVTAAQVRPAGMPAELPDPLYVRWFGSNSAYDDVRVPCCDYSELVDVLVTSPVCLRHPLAPADGRCHDRDQPDRIADRRLRIAITWSDGAEQVIHARTPRFSFAEAQPFRAREVQWTGERDPQQRVRVHEDWAADGWVHLGTAVRDVRFPDAPWWKEVDR